MNDDRWLPILIVMFGALLLLKAAFAGYGITRLDKVEGHLRSPPPPQLVELAKTHADARASLENSAARNAALAAELASERPALVAATILCFVFGVGAILCGLGIRRGKPRARQAWLWASLVLLGAIGFALASAPDRWYAFVPEASIAVVSLVVLMRRPASTQRSQ